MQVIRSLRACAVGVTALAGSSVALAGSASTQPLPSAEALAAVVALGLPSHALPTPGDQQIGEHRWARAGTCDVVRAGYHAPDAPVPAGSTLTDDVFGTITVQSPYGVNGILFEDQSIAGRCVYSIERSPTVRASVPGLVIADQFSPVACTTLLGFDATILTLITDRGEWTAFVAQPEGEAFTAAIVPGPKDVVSKMSDLPPEGIEAHGDATLVNDHLSFSGTSALGPVTIEASCTPDQLLQEPP